MSITFCYIVIFFNAIINIKKKDLLEKANLTTNCIANMSKNEYISLRNIEKIYKALQRDIGEVVCYCKPGGSINEECIYKYWTFCRCRRIGLRVRAGGI
ncbi:helix-turn-helix domain-containing protein [Mesomycoplasma ovipneumoniae]|uniref:helix-turn-helix domain-containing protein n=1 Tax=Mesomycoplasma ovipneumoniae TaxID=29562 RepID=UPI002FE6CAAC